MMMIMMMMMMMMMMDLSVTVWPLKTTSGFGKTGNSVRERR